MNRFSNKRYKSYKEKKSQNKRFRTYILRFLTILLFYSFFTTFIAISVRVTTDSMSPGLKHGHSVIMMPVKNATSLISSFDYGSFKRGEVVLTGTNYIVEPSTLEMILDPIVRIFTLQKKSLIYDNSDYRGRSEFLRVVGVPGDTIKIKDNTIYIKAEGEDFFLSEFELSTVDYDINKMVIDTSWKSEFPFSADSEEIYVEDNHYFLISDNRGVMNDSRIYGPVDKSIIIGKVIIKFWPVNEFRLF